MSCDNLELEEIINGLTKNLDVLAGEAQNLIDRQTNLEKKLVYAHEQTSEYCTNSTLNKYQFLADKYAVGDPEITTILSNFQLPSTSLNDESGYHSSFQSAQTLKLGIARVTEDVRMTTQRLTKFVDKLSGSTLSAKSSSGLSSEQEKSQSTILEKDFTISRNNCSTNCPFSPPTRTTKFTNSTRPSQLRINIESHSSIENQDNHPHDPKDPICAALYAETMNSTHSSTARSRCPIRFLGQHSPEEVAQYFQTHKHEIPRSHEICVKRQQRNEDHIRKLDAKYGNLVSMIEGLGEKHQPLLPEEDENLEMPNKRLEKWAKNVSPDGISRVDEEHNRNEYDREPRFDRPMKEIRVGESPSRPWGISIPIKNPLEGQNFESQNPIPVPVSLENLDRSINNNQYESNKLKVPLSKSLPSGSRPSHRQPVLGNVTPLLNHKPSVFTSCPIPRTTEAEPDFPDNTSPPINLSQPNFIKVPQNMSAPGVQMPQMIFTGPVFIGYPTEDTNKVMQQFN